LDIRIVELEALVEAFAREVELGTVEIGQAFGIDDDRDAAALEMMVFRRGRISIFEFVGEPGTPGRAHSQAHADALSALREIAGDVLRRTLGERNRHSVIQSAASGAVATP